MNANNEIAENSLGARIRRLRLAGALTQGELAASIGISQTAVGNWESGEYIPKGRHLTKLAEALSVNLGELMDVTTSIDGLTEEVRMLTAFRSLSKERQLIAIKLVEALN